MEKEDVVNKPKHYTDGNIEVIDFIIASEYTIILTRITNEYARGGDLGAVDPLLYIVLTAPNIAP